MSIENDPRKSTLPSGEGTPKKPQALNQPTEESSIIADLLYYLGITERYTAFHFISCAVQLILENPRRLTLVTKWLYPEVAKHFGSDPRTVEHSIRRAVNVVWDMRKEHLNRLAKRNMICKPTASVFLDILTSAILEGQKLLLSKDAARAETNQLIFLPMTKKDGSLDETKPSGK